MHRPIAGACSVTDAASHEIQGRVVYECTGGAPRVVIPTDQQREESIVAKGLEQKKETKKKPTKTLKEKRAEKAAKKSGK
jgi:hypothetical protein